MTDAFGRTWTQDKNGVWNYGGLSFSGAKDPLATANSMLTQDVKPAPIPVKSEISQSVDAILADPNLVAQLRAALV